VLSHLTIENFAIIDRIELALGPGLVALTGETGAGKSIVVDALGGLLGNRLTTDVIRAGAPLARIEGIFDRPPQPDFQVILAELGGETEDEDDLILSREIGRSGRNVARVNGRAVPLGTLQRIGRLLMDLHGQGDHLTLLRVAEHIRLLDGFAGHDSATACVRRLAQQIHALRNERASYDRDQREIARRLDLLRFQLGEISSAGLAENEDEQLRQERVLLANAERLASGIDQVRAALSEGDGDTAVDRLGEASSQLAELVRIDPTLADDQQAIELALDQVSDASSRLRRYREVLEFNPERLEQVEERLNQIRNLQRKYGSSIADVLAFATQAQQELDGLEHREERVAELDGREREAVAEFVAAATELSASRQSAARDLARAIETELAELNMPGATFEVRIDRELDPRGVELPDGRSVAFGPTGIDRVEFFIAPNAGEELKPLVRVVSGGETARLMLALKNILSRSDQVPTLIFDEVDAGLGGQTAVEVGRKIANLARERQIICVTHLSQIATFADEHVAVRKRAVDGRTRTEVLILSEDERVDELASMIGGAAGPTSARLHARDALRASFAWKAEHALVGRGT
jgi:DNA repair protein RecN (Recombination protein N)